MISLASFTTGFVAGFGSGVGFRALSENDFEPVKDVFRTTVLISQKIGDAVVDTFGRMKESYDDVRAQVRAQRARQVGAHHRPKKTRTHTRRSSQVLHA